jgi:nucleoside-diphosphate-sugar epimerase
VAESGAEPVTTDALDAASLKAAVRRVRPNAVINELTSLPRHYTAAEMEAAADRDRKVRIEGNANLLAAVRDVGVRRYLLQSSGFWYAPAPSLADETGKFAFDASPAVAAGARRYAELEATALETPGVEFVSLRYGFFYGPGTWYVSEGDMGVPCLAPRCLRLSLAVVSRDAHARPLCLTTNRKIKNMVNQRLRLLNGIAVLGLARPRQPPRLA